MGIWKKKKKKKINGFDDNNYDQQFKKAIKHGRKNLKINGEIKVPDFLMKEKNRIIYDLCTKKSN